LPPLTVHSNTAKYPAAGAPGGLAYDQRAILGALHPAPAGNAGQPLRHYPFLGLSLIANIINC